VTVDLRVPND